MSPKDSIENRNNHDSQGSMVTQPGSQSDQSDSATEDQAAGTSSGKQTSRKRRADCLETHCKLHKKCMPPICNVSVLDGLKAENWIKSAIEKALKENKIIVVLPALESKDNLVDTGDSY